MSSTITLSVSGLQTLRKYNPDSDYSSRSYVYSNNGIPRILRGEAGSESWQYVMGGIFRFNIPDILRYKRIVSAVLTYPTSEVEAASTGILRWAAYASSEPLSSIHYNNFQEKGQISAWGEKQDPRGTMTRQIDISPLLMSNTVDGVFNILIAETELASIGAWATIESSDVSLTIVYDSVEQPAPTLVYPVDVTMRQASSTVFAWQFNSVTEAVQASVQLEYKLSSDANYTVVTISGDAQSYMLSSQLAPGEYSWRAKVTNSAGDVSQYSAVKTFTVIGKPALPVIGTPENKTLTAITWNADDQCAYELVISDTSGKVIDSVSNVGAAAVYRPNVFLRGNYSVSIRVKNSSEIWSDWASKAFVISGTAPSSGSFIVRADGPDVYIDAQVPDGASAVIMRSKENGPLIILASVSDGETYKDTTVQNGASYEYVLRTYSDGYVDSLPKSCKVSFGGLIIDTEYGRVHLSLSEDRYMMHNEAVEREYAVLRFSGREYPLIERGELVSVSIEKRAFVKYAQRNDVDNLVNAVHAWYRDDRGNTYPAAVTRVTYTAFMDEGYTAVLELVRLDQAEVIVNV